MSKVAKNFGTVLIMGVPVWLALVGVIQSEPASLVIHLPEPGVKVTVAEHAVLAEKTSIGPLELEPGEHRIQVTRGRDLLFTQTVRLTRGNLTEVRVEWPAAKAASPGTRDGGELLEGGERKYVGHYSTVHGVGFSRDGQRVISAGQDSTFRIWDGNKGRPARELHQHSGAMFLPTLLAGGLQALTASDVGVLQFWDIETGALVKSTPTLSGASMIAVRCAAASRDAKRVAFGAEGGRVVIWDVEAARVLTTIELSPATPGGLAFSPDGRSLLIGMIGDPRIPHDIQIHDAATGRLFGRLRGHDEPVWSVAVLPDGRSAVSTSSDRTMRLWDIANARELRRFDNHPGAVLCVAVSPDGARALTGTGHRWAGAWRPADGYGVQLWDLENGSVLGRFETHEPVHSVAFSADGRRAAAAGGEEGAVHSWDLPL